MTRTDTGTESVDTSIPDVKEGSSSKEDSNSPALGAASNFVRSRFKGGVREVSGAFGDLGTFLPHIIGAITVVGMAPLGILTTFGLFYIVTGVRYGLPIAVQPMKAVSAVLLVEPMDPGAIAGAGLIIGLFFLVVGVTGLINQFTRLIPSTVASGLQLGLGLSLSVLGLRMIGTQPWLGLGISALILVLLRFSRIPAALIALILGVVFDQVFGLAPPFPDLELGLHLPSIMIPSWEEIVHGTQRAVLPQIPLTLTNAIIITAAVSRQLFPKDGGTVTERNLSITTGLGNLLAAPFGGFPMCHGAGGLSGHYRFGARTATAPVLIGLIFISLGVLLGDGGFALLKLIPDAVLGSLLLYAGVELARSSKAQNYREVDLFVVLLMTVICFAFNPAVAFAIGLPLAYASQRGWLRV